MSLGTFAQVPQGLNFQTIVRDQSGKPHATKNVNFRFSVLQGGTGGQVVYSEEHRAVSNEFGLVNLLLGYGFPLSGRFDQINWSAGSFFLKTEIDPNGGINYELSGVSPFLSVPYALYAGQTKLEAGPGIQIDGNKINNTGDPDPSDDLKIGSNVGGDLSGALPNPKVAGLQNRAVLDIQPNINQALVWNGSQWIPANIDNDPGNDLLINSAAGGDLGGSYPNPTVQKLNGFPLASTNPDSGDVLVFSQGEWKHMPVTSSPGSSHWRKSGTELIVDDPAIQTVQLNNSILNTRKELRATEGMDTSYMKPKNLYVTSGTGATKSQVFLGADRVQMFGSGMDLGGLKSEYSLGGIPYAYLEILNNDGASRTIGSYVGSGVFGITMFNPDRGSKLFGDAFEIYRKSKDSPVEYSGIEIRDSGLYFYQGNKDILYMESTPQWGGELFTYDKAGKGRIAFSELISDQTQPYVGLFSTKTNREVVAFNGYNSVGELTLYNSNTDEWILYAGYSSLGTAFPYIGISDGFGEDVAGFTLNNMGDGVMFADLKFFRMDDPEVAQQEIWYACVEGPEAAAYERGTGSLVNGEAYIKFSDHFRKVINPQSLTVQLTSLSASTYGLAVIEKNVDGFKVKELQNGDGNFSFDWEIKGVRQGYEDYQVYRKKETLRSQVKALGVKPPNNASNSFRNTRNRNK
ncbi:MAG: hypothetical protein IPM92_14755 [Saprospiraceae bacterium]|nr:hypothetical protein [Saprospiraceae bacterium]